MSRPTDLGKYGSSFFEVAERLEREPERVITIPVEEGMTAQRLRLSFHAFRTALQTHGKDKDFYHFNNATIGILPDGTGIYIAAADYTPEAQAIQKALGNIKDEKE